MHPTENIGQFLTDSFQFPYLFNQRFSSSLHGVGYCDFDAPLVVARLGRRIIPLAEDRDMFRRGTVHDQANLKHRRRAAKASLTRGNKRVLYFAYNLGRPVTKSC